MSKGFVGNHLGKGFVGNRLEARILQIRFRKNPMGNQTMERNGGKLTSARDVWETELSQEVIEIQPRKRIVENKTEERSCGKPSSARKLWENELNKELMANSIQEGTIGQLK